LVDEIRPIVKKCYQTYDAPSYFEMWLVLALKYFEKQKCDYVVLETGCGGRYDGTNAVAKTECSVITNIGLDHTHILGKTYEKIAYEKAGIIRSKGQVFTATDNPKALKVIQKVAEQQKATLDIYENQEKPNEALARAVADYLEIKEAKIAEGIKAAKLPCRFEIVKQKPIIILDGAHNPDKIAYLAEKYKAKYENRKLHLICALGAYKDPKKTFKALMPFVKKAYCTRFTTPQRKVTPPLELVKAFDRKPTEMNLDPQNALRSALRQATQNDIILVTGSFFLCGELRNNWLSEDWQLENRKSFK
jgi:dihydrofolate synthase/folylpolyglutamate synthase